MDKFLQAAVDEAMAGRREGGIPIGSVFVQGVISSVATITGASRRAASSYTAKWTRCKASEASRPEFPNHWNEDIGEE